MFICGKCKEPIGPGTSPIKVVTKTKSVIHPERTYKRKGEKVNDRGGSGTQIVTEEDRCLECA